MILRNRIAHAIRSPGEDPQTAGAFSDAQARQLLRAYRRNPADLACPACGQESVEVVAFIHPVVIGGMATVVPPVGAYAAAVWCCRCKRGIGLDVGEN